MTATVTGVSVGSFNYTGLTRAQIVEIGLKAGLSYFRDQVAEGMTRGRDLAIRGGFLEFTGQDDKRALHNATTIGTGNYPQYNVNLGEGIGKLSTVVKYLDNSDFAYIDHGDDDDDDDEPFFGDPETDPRTWPGGAIDTGAYRTSDGKLLEQEFAVAASGDWGAIDLETAKVALAKMVSLWMMQQRLKDEAAVAAKH